jgi:DNA replication protein DnaC
MIGFDEQIANLAGQLKLPTFAAYKEFIKRDASFHENLAALLGEEDARRSNAAAQRRIKQAGFPVPKAINTFKHRLPHLKRETVEELSACRFIAKKTNICALGPSGVGKTHLMTAIATEAIKNGYTVRFHRGNDVLVKLSEKKKKKRLGALNTALKKCDILCLDELGYVNVNARNADMLFNVVAGRHEIGSTYITSNYEFSKQINCIPP